MAWLDLAELVQDATRSVFAEPATYTPPAGAPLDVTVEFDAAAVLIETADGVAVQTVGPRCSVLLSEYPGGAVVLGATFVVRGVTYTVTAPPEPDGHGMALVRLHRS